MPPRYRALVLVTTPDALVFATESGRPIWRGNFNKLIGWKAAVARIKQPHLHFHDLRHTGNTLAPRTGASTWDLTARMGHDSPQAALIYQHATSEADRAIAQALHAAMHAGMSRQTMPPLARVRARTMPANARG